jgi:hypothetical protein
MSIPISHHSRILLDNLIKKCLIKNIYHNMILCLILRDKYKEVITSGNMINFGRSTCNVEGHIATKRVTGTCMKGVIDT